MRLVKAYGFVLLIIAAHAGAQSYPVKPIKLIIPFAAGGPQDAPLRPAALKLGEMLGQPVVIDYKPGAAATIGADYVAKSAPDG